MAYKILMCILKMCCVNAKLEDSINSDQMKMFT